MQAALNGAIEREYQKVPAGARAKVAQSEVNPLDNILMVLYAQDFTPEGNMIKIYEVLAGLGISEVMLTADLPYQFINVDGFDQPGPQRCRTSPIHKGR